MDKWADYGIFQVQFNVSRNHIQRVRVAKDNGTSFGEAEEYSRQVVVNLIKRGVTFVTIFRESNSKEWHKGQPVIIEKINNNEYLKSVGNKTKKDNLDNLPQF